MTEYVSDPNLKKMHDNFFREFHDLREKYGIERYILAYADPDSDLFLMTREGGTIWELGMANYMLKNIEAHEFGPDAEDDEGGFDVG